MQRLQSAGLASRFDIVIDGDEVAGIAALANYTCASMREATDVLRTLLPPSTSHI